MSHVNHLQSSQPVSEGHAHETAERTPLFADLDGTLVKSDLLIESLLVLIKCKPTACLLALGWLLRHGKGFLKSKIAEHVEINPQTLPYHAQFLYFLRTEAAKGRSIYLATASSQKFAKAIADYLGIFSGVLASDQKLNLKGNLKLAEIRRICSQGEFDYAGNARSDLYVWRYARRALLINCPHRIESLARKHGNVSAVFDDRQKRLFTYAQALRLHQWLKNVLLFVPLFTSHSWRLEALWQAGIAAIAFGLAASSVYVLNDMLDLNSDRLHPQKRTRPFASGALPLIHGVALMVVLALMSLALGGILSGRFLAALGAYLGLTAAYSVRLKQYSLVDVIILAVLYTLRLIAGAVAIDVVMSFWLLAFSMFLFLSLALVKRCSELVSLREIGVFQLAGRHYAASDLTNLTIMGTASAYVSVLVLALFINSQDVTMRYSNPQMLWLLCPLMLYWVSRVWLKTGRGEMDVDPIIFALRDYGSRYVVAAIIAVVLLAI